MGVGSIVGTDGGHFLITGWTPRLPEHIAAQLKHITDLNVATSESPFGRALIGHVVGDRVTFTLPNGRIVEINVNTVEQFSEQS